MEFEVKDGKILVKGVTMGTLADGKVSFDLDELRHLVISQSRIARGHPIEGRPKKKLLEAHLKAGEKEKGLKADKQKDTIHNLERIIFAYESQLKDTNRELNELRKQCKGLKSS